MSEVFKNIIYMARRFKIATWFNIICLVVAFATFYLLLTQIHYQRTYNHQVKDYERVYRMETNYVYKEWDYSEHVCPPFANALKHLSQQVESYSLSRNDDVYSFPFQKGDEEVIYTFNQGNNSVVSALAGQAVDGNIEWTDQDDEGVIIPASIATDYFGTTQAAGREMKLIYRIPGEPTEIVNLTVRGVYADFPENSELFNCIYQSMGDGDIMDFNYIFRCYVKFKDVPHDIEAVASELKQAIIDDINLNITDESFKQDILEEMQDVNIRFTPLSESYFANNTFSSANRGYKSIHGFLIVLCLLIIMIAGINFLNFTLVESPMRVRGINTRLVLGATRRSLRLEFCAECIIISIASCLVALLLCQLLSCLEISKVMMDGDIGLTAHPGLVLLSLAIALVVGIAASIYPAIFATSFQPAMALKGSFGLTPMGLRLRTILITIQLFISMFMVLYVGILYTQRHYIFNTSYGFNKDQVFSTSIDANDETKHQLQQELLDMNGVENVSYSAKPLGITDAHNLIKTKNKNTRHRFEFNFLMVDTRFLNTMGIELVEGRPFTSSDTAATIINETARKKWNWIKIGNKLSSTTADVEGDSVTIIGVYKDVRYGTMRTTNKEPYCLIVKDHNLIGSIYINVRFSHAVSMLETKRHADELIKKYCGKNTKPLTSYNATLESVYHSELHYLRLFTAISIICLIINLIGVFCMTMFETEYRRKEIGIRKVSGALTHEIVWMLCKRYSWLVLISFMIAAPFAGFLGWYTITSLYADHTDIHWWIFPLTLVLVGSVMLGTIALQSWRAARETPVNSIKSE